MRTSVGRHRPIATVVAAYLAVGALWMSVTSPLLERASRDWWMPSHYLEVAKGLFFVLVTGVALWLVLRRFEISWARSQRQLQLVADTVQEGLYVFRLEPDHGFEYVNPALEKSTGFTAEQFYQDPDLMRSRLHPDDVRISDLSRRDPEAVSWPVKLRLRHRNGNWVWHEVRESPIYKDDGTVVAVQGLAIDITARVAADNAVEQALRHEHEAAQRYREANQTKTLFLRALSHELRTPLTVILGFSSTLATHLDDLPAEQTRLMLTRMHAQTEQLRRLLEDLLDVDRLDRGVIQLVPRPTDVHRLIMRVCEQFDFHEHHVRVTTTQMPPIDLDAPKVERIVENLVVNAVQHTPAGTNVDISATAIDGGVLVTVEDDGPGVPDDLKDDIFAAFRQGSASATAPSPGTGIGLTLVAEFAALHGGRAWVEDPPEGGAAFKVYLPDH